MRKVTLMSVPLGILALFSAMSPPLSAQAGDGVYRAARVSFALGMSTLDLEQLNGGLDAHGLQWFDGQFFAAGVTAHGIRNRLIFGAEGRMLLDGSKSSVGGRFRSRMSVAYGLLNVGYILNSKDGLDLYPLLGLGLGRAKVEVYEQSTGEFADILGAPGTGTRLETGGLLLSLSLGMDQVWVPGRVRDQGLWGGLVFSLRGGYMFQLNDSPWKLNGYDAITNGPEIGGGFFVHGSLGGWGDNQF